MRQPNALACAGIALVAVSALALRVAVGVADRLMSFLARVVERLRHGAVGFIEALLGVVRGLVQIPLRLSACVLGLSARLVLIRLTTRQTAAGQQCYDPKS